jgi:hypothetical protein
LKHVFRKNGFDGEVTSAGVTQGSRLGVPGHRRQ